jgi:hypothetical protein
MIDAEHFKEIRKGRTVSVDGFVLVPVFTVNLSFIYERMVSYEYVVENQRNFPHIFSCTMASFDDPPICFFQIGNGAPKEFREVMSFIERSTIGPWCFIKNGTFVFSDSADAAIVSSYLHS